MRNTARTTIVLLSLAALLLTGCNSADEGSSEPASAADRAQSRWDHLVAGEYAQAWEYFTPGYRETAPVEAYVASIQRRPVEWQAAAVVGSDCEEARCEVAVDVTYSVPRARAGLDTVKPTRTIRETWILTEGAWWFSPEN